jgi:hypothetical protein
MAFPALMIACSKKRELLQEFAKAVSEVNRIHSAQLRAVLNDEGFRFQEELDKATTQRESAKYAVLEHQREHG